MKTVKVLYDKDRNENSDTPAYPVALYVDGMVDLDATTVQCANWDDNRLVTSKRYSVREFAVPDDASDTDILRYHRDWSYMLTTHGWFRSLSTVAQVRWLSLDSERREGAQTLLTTRKFRSPARESLCSRLRSWLEGQVESLSGRDLDMMIPFRQYRRY